MQNAPVTSFAIASSLPITLWPLGGLALSAHRSGADFDFSIAAIVIPLLFGTFHVICRARGLPQSRKAYLFAGAGLGLVMASIGTFVANVPETVYGLVGNTRYLALLGGPVFYGAVWGLVLWPAEQYVLREMGRA